METHSIAPFYNKDSKILILGSFPSVKSREEGFYYAHPSNRFWEVLRIVFNSKKLDSILAKKEFLKKHKIALYDVCYSCEITGSSDSTIKKVKVCNIKKILNESKIEKIFVNGKVAYNLYNKYLKDKLKMEAIYLPSTSPANAKKKLNDLVNDYLVLSNY